METRQLLAGDFLHNSTSPEDVNNDGQLSAGDALAVINAMSRREARDVDRFTDVNNDSRRSASDALLVINRLGRDGPGPLRAKRPGKGHGPHRGEVRSIDGSGNNLGNPELGSAGSELLRITDAAYADGISEPAGRHRPSARVISNLLSAADPEGTPNDRKLSSYVFMWGQFLDHDIDLSEAPSDEADQQPFPIEVPAGDPWFDPSGTGQVTIPLTRSEVAEGTGTSAKNPAQQVNSITAWIDGSQIYGSDQTKADSLREWVGGRLLMSEDGMLPKDDDAEMMAGDVRAAENVTLTSMHALFVREHNRIADQIAAAHRKLSDEEIYQRARSLVIAELQAITYNEFLPALLGERVIPRYRGYDASVDPSIANEFSTAAFRFGHSTLTDQIKFIGNDGQEVREAVSLAEAFFNPSMLEQSGIDALLKFGASGVAQEIDLQVIDSLRNFLFGPPGAGGLDLVSLNIQRGRDHGLADYNSTRVAYGLEGHESFADLTSDSQLQQHLETLYGDIDNVDLWVGLLAEDHVAGSSLGELASTIILDQFERLRNGDRFWYQNVLKGRELKEIDRTTLADIIERNTAVDSLQDNVFFFRPTVSGRITAEVSAGKEKRPKKKRPDRRRVVPMAGMAVELMNSEGDVIATAVTDQKGRYRFDSFTETGAFQIRMAAENPGDVLGADTLDVLISSGDSRMSGYDFVMTI